MPKLTVKRKARANGEGTIFPQEVPRKVGSTYTRWIAKTPRLANGKRKTLYGKTQKEVREKLEKVKREIASGVFVETNLTLVDYLEQWLKEKQKHVKRSTFAEYQRCVYKNVTPRVGKLKLSNVKAMTVQSLISEIADTSGIHRANKVRSILYSAFKQAILWQMATYNPVEAVDPLPLPRKAYVLWSPTEAARFLDAARPHRLYALFYLAMATGLRRGELLGLCWDDVKGNMLHVERSLIIAGREVIVSTPKLIHNLDC